MPHIIVVVNNDLSAVVNNDLSVVVNNDLSDFLVCDAHLVLGFFVAFLSAAGFGSLAISLVAVFLSSFLGGAAHRVPGFWAQKIARAARAAQRVGRTRMGCGGVGIFMSLSSYFLWPWAFQMVTI